MIVQGAWAQTEVSTEDELNNAIADGANIQLMGDIALSNYVNVNGNVNVTIDLNGYSLSRSLSEVTAYGRQRHPRGRRRHVDHQGQQRRQQR